MHRRSWPRCPSVNSSPAAICLPVRMDLLVMVVSMAVVVHLLTDFCVSTSTMAG